MSLWSARRRQGSRRSESWWLGYRRNSPPRSARPPHLSSVARAEGITEMAEEAHTQAEKIRGLVTAREPLALKA